MMENKLPDGQVVRRGPPSNYGFVSDVLRFLEAQGFPKPPACSVSIRQDVPSCRS